MNNVNKKDIITIVAITLILFVITEIFVAFNDGISIIRDNFIIAGIILSVLVLLIFLVICKKLNIKVKKNKINNIVFWSISICVVLYRFLVLGYYVEYKIKPIYDMMIELDDHLHSANNFRELLDILKVTQSEEEILRNCDGNEVIDKISNMDSVLMNEGFVVCTYDSWKILNEYRAFSIKTIWNFGEEYGFGETGYKKFIKENGYIFSNYREGLENIGNNLISTVSTIIIVPTICEICISVILFIIIRQRDGAFV